MFSSLLPYKTDYFEFFAKHAAIVVEAAEKFKEMVSHERLSCSNHKVIKQYEHEADIIVHACLESLHKTFITPIDRDDIYRLMTRMDDIIDCIDEAFERIIIYKIETLTEETRLFADVICRAAVQVQKAVNRLHEIGDGVEIAAICASIHVLENEADDILRSSLGKLFEEEPDTRMVIKWKEIYDNLEKATDSCVHASDVIQGIILEYV
ncbi:MAG: DUF47 family protein [Parachlamydiales bacterium]|jgi:hypothetical protein